MTTTLSDAELVAAHLAGDRTALAAIYDRYSAGLYDTAAAMLSDRHDAADMVQDVFCIAAERLGQLRDPERLKPWLYAVLRNEVYRRTKRRRRTTPTDFQSETVPDVVAPTDPGAEGASVAFAELASLVRAAAAGLDERDQLILELSIRQGLDGADLADALGVTPEQSYSMVHRMRERVDRSLGAFVVAKAGRRECSTLDEILRDWDGEFNVLIRKRVARHIESCETCASTKGKVAPLALFGAAPVLAAPLGLRERVLEAASRIPTSNSPGGSRGGSSGKSGSTSRIRLRPSDGFPRASRILGRGAWWATGVVVMVAAGSVVMIANTDSAPASNDSSTNDSSITIVDESPETSTETTSTATSITTAAGVTPLPTPPPAVSPDPASSTPVSSTPESPTNAPTTTGSSGTATTVATSPTSTSAPSNSSTAPALVALVSNLSSIDFGTSSTSATFTIKNPNKTAVSWKLSSTRPNHFTFSPSSGSITTNGTVTVTVTFARTSATSYTNTSTFPEGRFDVAARITATGAPTTPLRLVGTIGRPPRVGTIATRFSGTSCANISIQVPVSDESSLTSVRATLALVGGSSSSSRTLILKDSGKGVWVGSSADLPGSTTAVTVSVTATDSTGQSATTGTKVTRPSSC
jgi:RNA polymerase sigma factor (sigma-70 family)